jgi:hypothetical protein
VLSPSRIVFGHLSERALVDAWQDGLRPAHLDACATCQERYVALVAFLGQQRDDALDRADGVFTPERLAAQKTHVLRRLENLARPVRVLPFPLLPRMRPTVSRVGRQWIAMAAAAGLVIGLAAGLMVNVHPFGSDFAQRSLSTQTAGQRPSAAARKVQEPALSDEAFLSELESALVSPGVAELQALDALTPRVREVALIVR